MLPKNPLPTLLAWWCLDWNEVESSIGSIVRILRRVIGSLPKEGHQARWPTRRRATLFFQHVSKSVQFCPPHRSPIGSWCHVAIGNPARSPEPAERSRERSRKASKVGRGARGLTEGHHRSSTHRALTINSARGASARHRVDRSRPNGSGQTIVSIEFQTRPGQGCHVCSSICLGIAKVHRFIDDVRLPSLNQSTIS